MTSCVCAGVRVCLSELDLKIQSVCVCGTVCASVRVRV